MRKLIPILMIPVCFLLIFSIYRKLNNSEPLTVNTFLNTLNQLDYDFDNTQEYISNVNNNWQSMLDNWSKPIQGDIVQVIVEMFARIGNFFAFMGSVIFIVFGFLFDFILLFISIIKIVFSMLGFVGGV